eukprot:scaffold1170_cov174-Amphora_coffeaeformis.AAC.19
MGLFVRVVKLSLAKLLLLRAVKSSFAGQLNDEWLPNFVCGKSRLLFNVGGNTFCESSGVLGIVGDTLRAPAVLDVGCELLCASTILQALCASKLPVLVLAGESFRASKLPVFDVVGKSICAPAVLDVDVMNV